MNAKSIILNSLKQTSTITVPCLPKQKLGFDTDYIEGFDIEAYVDTLENFLMITPKKMRQLVEPKLYLEYTNYMEINGFTAEHTINPIWDTLSFEDLNLVEDSNGIYVQVVAESSWGHAMMQLIFKNGETLTNLGEEDGHYS